MPTDNRENAARYYDLSPSFPDDIPFYREQIPSPAARVLELGCGTGRVLLGLVDHCAFIVGVDASVSMISICRQKLQAKGVRPSDVRVRQADITTLRLDQQFDLIIAPFRVFQNLETDAQVQGFFSTVRAHLAPGGKAIVNTFNPNMAPDALRERWCREEEELDWEAPVEGGRATLHVRRGRIDSEKLVLYPRLIYRRYELQGEEETLVDEAILNIAMRCYYPAGLLQLIRAQRFRILDTWGGYEGQPYGEGPELVVAFTPANGHPTEP